MRRVRRRRRRRRMIVVLIVIVMINKKIDYNTESTPQHHKDIHYTCTTRQLRRNRHADREAERVVDRDR
jgi:hypothetical protein